MKNTLLLLQIVISLLGLADASYLTWEKIQGVIPSCNAAFQCETVLNSAWASLGPVPVSALGMVFYLTFLGIISTRFLAKETLIISNRSLSLQSLSNWLGVIGLGVSVILVTVMAVVLKAWCLFCLVSATTASLLALTTGGLYFLTRSERQNEN